MTNNFRSEPNYEHYKKLGTHIKIIDFPSNLKESSNSIVNLSDNKMERKVNLNKNLGNVQNLREIDKSFHRFMLSPQKNKYYQKKSEKNSFHHEEFVTPIENHKVSVNRIKICSCKIF